MNYALYLMQLLAGLAPIAQFVQAFHANKSVDEKVAVASSLLSIATDEVSRDLSPDNARLAKIAGVSAQNILAVTMQAVHDAHSGFLPAVVPPTPIAALFPSTVPA